MKEVHHLQESPSVINDYMEQLRDVELQQDRSRFRENIKRIGRAVGFELSKTFTYSEKRIQTPLAVKEQKVISDSVVVITILRAGLPLHEGILDAIPQAENGFISAYRKHDEKGGFEIDVGYVACPNLDGKILILNDPMLATGSSFLAALEALKSYGAPKKTHMVAVIASQDGVDYVSSKVGGETELWVAAVDPELNDDKYIVPGLGDAGDLAFGEKLQS